MIFQKTCDHAWKERALEEFYVRICVVCGHVERTGKPAWATNLESLFEKIKAVRDQAPLGELTRISRLMKGPKNDAETD